MFMSDNILLWRFWLNTRNILQEEIRFLWYLLVAVLLIIWTLSWWSTRLEAIAINTSVFSFTARIRFTFWKTTSVINMAITIRLAIAIWLTRRQAFVSKTSKPSITICVFGTSFFAFTIFANFSFVALTIIPTAWLTLFIYAFVSIGFALATMCTTRLTLSIYAFFSIGFALKIIRTFFLANTISPI